MSFRIASAPAWPGRENEDFAAVGPDGAVLLDGAGTPPGVESGCGHGVAWFARTLGALMLSEMAGEMALTDALASGIDRVRMLHEHTCDLKSADTPSATVVAVRLRGAEVEYLVLSDSVLLLDYRDGDLVAVSDDRQETVARDLRAEMDAEPTGSPEHAEALRALVAALAEQRNTPGGFWVANTDPAAAEQAITGQVPRNQLRSLALLSDGASLLTDRFHLTTWRETLATLNQHGPRELIRQVRQAEHGDPYGRRWPRGKTHDDATALHWPLID